MSVLLFTLHEREWFYPIDFILSIGPVTPKEFFSRVGIVGVRVGGAPIVLAWAHPGVERKPKRVRNSGYTSESPAGASATTSSARTRSTTQIPSHTHKWSIRFADSLLLLDGRYYSYRWR